jgi:pyruvate/2-oxoglutarate dehydrogenase complex dihydrolipoamide acyltransferase (E2) component
VSSSRTSSGAVGGASHGQGPSLVEVTMPQMGVSVAEGTIVEWRKRPGDWVDADEAICDVTTDKIDVEIPSPASGRLERILVEPGTTVAVGTALAEIDAQARPGEAHPDEHDGRASDGGQRTDQTPGPAPAESAAQANGEADRSRFY